MSVRVQRGFNLPEILIALALGLFLLAAFLTVVARCRDQFTANESVARLQDGARHALGVIGDDLEHAGFWGFSNAATPRLVSGAVRLAAAAELRQDETIAPVTGLPAGAHACGINFAVDVARPVEGHNNGFGVGREARDCEPTATAGGARVGSDTLTVRHASAATAAAHDGRIQLYARRLAAHASLDLFSDGRAPGVIAEDAHVRDLDVHVWYVANDSVERPGWPALRVKSLTESRGAAQFRDEEVLPGVEDLQVEFAFGDGTHIRWATPDSPLIRTGPVLAVRVWLRIRSDASEPGFVDARPLAYSDATFLPTPVESRQRRVLVQRTVALRNVSRHTARGAELP